jgi:serine/threonine-protein kinase
LDEGQTVKMFVSSGLVEVPVPSVRDLKEAEAVGEVEGRRLQDPGPPCLRRRAEGRRRRAGASRRRARGEGIDVVLTVSKGRNLKPVPDLVGQQEGEAVSKLRAAGFTARILRRAVGRAAGHRRRRAAAAGGEQAPPDSRVRLNISTGEETGQTTERPPRRRPRPRPGAARVTVPSVVGLAQTPALRRSQHRPSAASSHTARPTSRAGRVIEQRPRASGQLSRNAPVQLIVSSGTTAGEALDVPDVTGVSEDEARQTLEDAGFRVEVIRTGDGDTVEDQQPEFGVTSFRGAVVTLLVG